MHAFVRGKRHCAQLNLADGLEQRGSLLRRGKLVDFRKIQVLASVSDVACRDPVGGNNAVKPRQPCFVRVAVVAGAAEYRLHLGRRLHVRGNGRIRQFGANELNAQNCST